MRKHTPACPPGPHRVCVPFRQNVDRGRDNRDGRDRDRVDLERRFQEPATNGELPPDQRNGNGAPAGGGVLRPVAPVVEEAPPPEITEIFLLQELISAVNALREAVIEPPVPEESGPEQKVLVVQVETAGEPVQPPEIIIPTGSLVIFRQRHHDTDRNGYVSFEGQAAVGNPFNRVETKDNDSFTVRLSTLEDVWFDADAVETFFEIIFRQTLRKLAQS